MSRPRALALSTLLVALGCGSSGSGGTTASGDDTGVSVGDAATDSVVAEGAPSTDTGSAPTDSGPSTDGTVADALGDYPAGPYGNVVGTTFPALDWAGYVDDAADAVATTKPYGTYSSDAVRRSGKRYLLVHVAETG